MLMDTGISRHTIKVSSTAEFALTDHTMGNLKMGSSGFRKSGGLSGYDTGCAIRRLQVQTLVRVVFTLKKKKFNDHRMVDSTKSTLARNCLTELSS